MVTVKNVIKIIVIILLIMMVVYAGVKIAGVFSSDEPSTDYVAVEEILLSEEEIIF